MHHFPFEPEEFRESMCKVSRFIHKMNNLAKIKPLVYLLEHVCSEKPIQKLLKRHALNFSKTKQLMQEKVDHLTHPFCATIKTFFFE